MIDTEKQKLPQGAWLVVAFLFIVGALNYIDRNMITTMRSSLIESIPMSDAQFGLLTSMFLWVYGLLSPFAGFLADKFKRSYIVIGSLLVWSIVTWLTGHATTYEHLLISRALMGISEAFYIPAALALITDYHRGSTQALATGINLTGIMVGSSLGFVGGWIAERYTWNIAFNGFGIIGIAYAVVLIFFLKDVPKNIYSQTTVNYNKQQKSEVHFSDAFKNVLNKPSFIYLLIVWGVLGIVNWMIVAWLPTYYKEQFNLSQSLAGFYATAYFYPVGIIGLLSGGFLSDYLSKKNPLSRVIIPIIGLGLAAPSIFMGSISSVLYLAIIFFSFYALTSKFLDTNTMPMLVLMLDNRYRATGYGILNMVSTLTGGIGIYAAGIFRDYQINLSSTYRNLSLIVLVSAGILFLVKRKIKTEKNFLWKKEN